MPNIDHVINDRIVREAERQAKWVDSKIKSLLSPFNRNMLSSSKVPELVKKAIMNTSGVEVCIMDNSLESSTKIIIKQRGVVKAERTFKYV